MFKAIGWVIKTALFAGLILVLGQVLHWKGETLSDQVKYGLASASEQPAGLWERFKDWAGELSRDASEAVRSKRPTTMERAASAQRRRALHESQTRAEPAVPPAHEIPGSERQKLRALIQELNQPRAKN